MNNKRVVDNILEMLDGIAKIKLQLIINKDLYQENCITYEAYKTIEEKLLDRLQKAEQRFEYA